MGTGKNSFTKILAMLLTSIMLIFAGCYQSHLRDPVVVIYPDSVFIFKLQFKDHVTGRGNMHNMDLKYYDYDHSDWIYLRRRIGILDTSQFVFTHFYSKTNYPWQQTPLRGFVELTQDSVRINLEFPYYATGNDISYWTKCELNGKYKLRVDSIVPPFGQR